MRAKGNRGETTHGANRIPGETTICPIIIILYPELSSLLCYITSLSTLILAVKIRENVKFQMSAAIMKGYG
jgi:hypothetical protein